MSGLQTIEEVFDGKFFRIPDYQRGYSWEARHVRDLLEDLELLGADAEHYAGTLVLHKSGDDVYDIVDGQQRTTTIVMLLDCIGRALAEDEEFARGLRKKYIAEKNKHGFERPRLALNKDTRDFFEANIIAEQSGIGGAMIQSHKRLSDAHRQMREHLADFNNAALRALYGKVTTGLRLIVYEVKAESDVGVMFEVMNNRGKALSELEKVKNYLLYIASKISEATVAQQLTDKVNSVWSKILTQLMSAAASSSFDEDRMLRAHWLMAYNPSPKHWQGLASIKEQFPVREACDDPNKIALGIVEYLSSLHQFSVAYCDIVSPSRSVAFAKFSDSPKDRAKIQRAALKLARLGALTSFLPLVAALRIRNPGEANKLLPVLEACELYAARVYKFAGCKANAGQSYLFHLGYNVYHKHTAFETVLPSVYGRLEYYAPEANFLKMLEEPAVWYGWAGTKYLLYEYEEHLAKGRPVILTWEHCLKTDSIEHILPQSWEGVHYWKTRWTKDDAEKYLHSLGNLCLTFNNTELSNHPFPIKKGKSDDSKPCYAASSLFMEKKLTQYEHWTPKECQERRAEIVAWMAERWKIDEKYKAAKSTLAEVTADADESGNEGS